MKVKELMSTNIVCIAEDTPVLQIAGYMRKNNIGSLPVCDQAGHLKGIVTDRDLVLRTLAKLADSCAANPEPSEKIDIKNMTAADVMTSNPVTTSPDTNIHDASLLFSAHQVRRLPVMEASKIVGMLSLGDVAVKRVYIDEAGDALSSISLPDGLPAGN